MLERLSAFESPARGRLVCRTWVPTSARGTLLFLHGWGDHGGAYAELARLLAARGFACFAPDFHGHGLSPGPRARVHDFAALREDLDALVRSVAPRDAVFLCGHSMGGALAAHYAILHPERVAGVIFSSAALAVNVKVSRVKRALAELLGATLPLLPVGRLKSAEHMCADPRAQQQYRDDPLIHHGQIDAGTGRCLLGASQWIELHRERLSRPFLALQGTQDELVSAAGPRMLVAARPGLGTLMEFPHARHDLLRELGAASVAESMLGWLDRELGRTFPREANLGPERAALR